MEENRRTGRRYGMFIPLALMIASLVSSFISYSATRQGITENLNESMLALANEKRELWISQDTITALRHIYNTTHKPIIYQASGLQSKYPMLNDDTYISLTLVGRDNNVTEIDRNKIMSDSILIVSGKESDCVTVQVQAFTNCSMASIFSASDQTLPGILLTLSVVYMATMSLLRKKEAKHSEIEHAIPVTAAPSIDEIKLTPMQRRFTRILLDAPNRKVDKATLCSILWDDKINAEESLYTLVRRTKTALADTGMEIVCNRGDSYELRINA